MRFTCTALLCSRLDTTFRNRLSAGLDASSRLAQGLSLPLPEEQWKVEARMLFETALARSQTEARNLVRGVESPSPEFLDLLERNPTLKPVCTRYRLYAQDVKNINIWGTGCIVASLFILALLSVEVYGDTLIVAICRRPWAKKALSFVVTVIWASIKSTVSVLWAILSFMLRLLWRQIVALIGRQYKGGLCRC